MRSQRAAAPPDHTPPPLPPLPPHPPTEPTSSRPCGAQLSALRRFAVLSNTGGWMQRVAQDWFVLSRSHSPTAVGLTIAAQFAPTLAFGLYGGVIADRYPRRGLLIVTQSIAGLLSVVLAVLALPITSRSWASGSWRSRSGWWSSSTTRPGRASSVSWSGRVDPQRGEPELHGLPARRAGRPGHQRRTDRHPRRRMGVRHQRRRLPPRARGTAPDRPDPVAVHPPSAEGAGQLREGLHYIHERPGCSGWSCWSASSAASDSTCRSC